MFNTYYLFDKKKNRTIFGIKTDSFSFSETDPTRVQLQNNLINLNTSQILDLDLDQIHFHLKNFEFIHTCIYNTVINKT